MHLRYLWAKHPAIAGGGVHHVQAVSSHAIPSWPGCTGPLSCHTFHYSPRDWVPFLAGGTWAEVAAAGQQPG